MINDDLKEFINEVCDVLEIPIPNISDDFRVFENNTRMAVLAIEKNVPTLYLCERMETEQDYYFAVAHELRHLWQYITNEKYWLGGYKNRRRNRNNRIQSAKAGDRRKRICCACYGAIFWDGPDVPVAGLGDTAHDRSSCAPDHAGIGRLNFTFEIF